MADRRPKFHSCKTVFLPDNLLAEAHRTAIEHNPANGPPEGPAGPDRVFLPIARIFGRTTFFWKPGTQQPVYFLDNPDQATRKLILRWANEWGRKGGDLPYVETMREADAHVRLDRARGEGYYSYLGTQNLNVPRGQKTMNLDSFTSRTPESEYARVVTHEFGHQRNYEHGQLRRSTQALLDREKVIRLRMREQGWTRQQVIDQELVPANEAEITADGPDEELISVMMYPYPPLVTKNRKPIPGGDQITERDWAFDRRMYGIGPAEPLRPGGPLVLAVGGPPLADGISAQRETDWWPIPIPEPGAYAFLCEPAMVLGLYPGDPRSDNVPDLDRILGKAYGPDAARTLLTLTLPSGPHVLGVRHHSKKGTGPYAVSCTKA